MFSIGAAAMGTACSPGGNLPVITHRGLFLQSVKRINQAVRPAQCRTTVTQ